MCVSDVQLFYFAGYIFLSSVLLLHGKYRQHCPGHHQPEDIPQVRSQLRRTCEEVDCEIFDLFLILFLQHWNNLPYSPTVTNRMQVYTIYSTLIERFSTYISWYIAHTVGWFSQSYR